MICSQFVSSVTKTSSSCAPMAESDRSRSPVPGRNRAEPRAPVPPVRQELPFFLRWCGPMQLIGHLALTTNVTTSVSTSDSTSVQFTIVGTLFSESTHQSKSSHSDSHMVKSTISTGTPIVTSTYSGISIPISSNNSTLLTYLAVSTHSSCISQHSINPIVPTSSIRHSIFAFTRRTYNC